MWRETIKNSFGIYQLVLISFTLYLYHFNTKISVYMQIFNIAGRQAF